MPRCTRIKLNKGIVESLETDGQDRLYWDSELPAFGLRVHPSGAKSFFVDYYSNGRRGRMSLGAHGVLTCDEARRRAREILVGAEKGVAPLEERRAQRAGMLLREFWEIYLDDARPRWKPRTREENVRLWGKRVEPSLGDKPLDAIKTSEIAALHRSLSQTPVTANCVLRLVKAIFSRAVALELLEANPAARVKAFPEKKRERFLTVGEIQALFGAIDEEEHLAGKKAVAREGQSVGRGGKGMAEVESRGISPHAAALFRLLLFTGARLREVMNAKWSWVRWEEKALALPDSKTGAKRIPLSAPAIEELKRLREIRTQDVWIIEGTKPGAALVNPEKPWRRVRERAGLAECRLHDLRHSWASIAVGENLSLLIVGRALGHSQARTTQRYAHLSADPVLDAAEIVGARILDAVKHGGARVVPIEKKAEGAGQ